MRGLGLHWVIILFSMILLLVLIISTTVLLYFRSATIGQPIEIRTFTEYRWSNYLPSATLFYLTYPIESWQALMNISTSQEIGIWSKENFFNYFGKNYDLTTLRYYIDALEDALRKQGHTLFIKDSKGLIISLGLPYDYIDIHGFTTFPDEYPYNCYISDMPIYSKKEHKNLRLKLAICCKDIVRCEDYLTGPGRTECSKDPCKISSKGYCKEIYCVNESIEGCIGKKKSWVCLDRPILVNLMARTNIGPWKEFIKQSVSPGSTITIYFNVTYRNVEPEEIKFIKLYYLEETDPIILDPNNIPTLEYNYEGNKKYIATVIIKDKYGHSEEDTLIIDLE